jgi:cytochrome c-type biogenesis protein CcmH/NrfG
MMAMLLVPVAGLAGISWWLFTRDAIKARDVIAAVVLVAWIAVVGTKVYLDRVPAEAQEAGVASTFRVPEWSREARVQPAPAVPSAAGETGVVTAAPIAELIGGLETRLTSEPDDVKGWALLAQSYAFVGNAADAERALQRAVALGADELEVRARVQAARRGPDTRGWIEQTVGR